MFESQDMIEKHIEKHPEETELKIDANPSDERECSLCEDKFNTSKQNVCKILCPKTLIK